MSSIFLFGLEEEAYNIVLEKALGTMQYFSLVFTQMGPLGQSFILGPTTIDCILKAGADTPIRAVLSRCNSATGGTRNFPKGLTLTTKGLKYGFQVAKHFRKKYVICKRELECSDGGYSPLVPPLISALEVRDMP